LKLKLTLYISVFILASVFCIYYFFPSETLENFLALNIKKIDSKLDINIEKTELSFPLGVSFKGIDLFYKKDELIRLDRVRISPEIFSVLGQKPIFKFKAYTCGGFVSGQVNINKNDLNKEKPVIFIDTSLNDISIKDIHGIYMLMGGKITEILAGTLEGKAEFRLQNGAVNYADANVCFSDCSIKLAEPLSDSFSMGQNFFFSSISTNFILNNRKLKIKEFIINSDKIEARVSGSVVIKKPAANSLLNLNGKIKPGLPFITELVKSYPFISFFKKNGLITLPLKINGTVNQPGFSLM